MDKKEHQNDRSSVLKKEVFVIHKKFLLVYIHVHIMCTVIQSWDAPWIDLRLLLFIQKGLENDVVRPIIQSQLNYKSGHKKANQEGQSVASLTKLRNQKKILITFSFQLLLRKKNFGLGLKISSLNDEKNGVFDGKKGFGKILFYGPTAPKWHNRFSILHKNLFKKNFVQNQKFCIRRDDRPIGPVISREDIIEIGKIRLLFFLNSSRHS